MEGPLYSRVKHFQRLVSSTLSRKSRIAPSQWWTPVPSQKETLQLASVLSASPSLACLPFISNPEPLWLCFQAFGYFGEHLRSKWTRLKAQRCANYDASSLQQNTFRRKMPEPSRFRHVLPEHILHFSLTRTHIFTYPMLLQIQSIVLSLWGGQVLIYLPVRSCCPGSVDPAAILSWVCPSKGSPGTSGSPCPTGNPPAAPRSLFPFLAACILLSFLPKSSSLTTHAMLIPKHKRTGLIYYASLFNIP